MRSTHRLAVLLLMSSIGTAPLPGQQPGEDRPKPLRPRPASREERDQVEAVKRYGLAMLRQRQDRLVEAQHLLEEARQLDPKAVAVHKALVPIYLALGRGEEALAACRAALDLDPDDFDTWFLFARELRDRGSTAEAIDALTRGSTCAGAAEHLDLVLQMKFDLGNIHEQARDLARAEKAYGEVVQLFEQRQSQLVDAGPFSQEQLEAETAKTYERLGRVCTLAGRYPQAVAAYTQAQKHDPEHAGRLSYNLAEVHLAQDHLDQAVRCLDAYLRGQPQGAQAYELKIDILRRLKRVDEIVPSLEQDAQRDPHNMALQLLLARQYVRFRMWDRAEALYERLGKEAPTAEVYRGLFLAFRDQRKLSRVIDTLDATLKAASPADDDGAADGDAAARARAMLQVLREEPALVDGLLTTAVAELKRRRPEALNPAGEGRSRITLRFLAVLAARAHHLDHAEALYTSCLHQLTPRSEAEVYGGLLEVLYQGRKFEEVLRVARMGLDQSQTTNRVLFHRMLALALAQLGRGNEAVKEADAAVRLAGEDDRLRLELFRAEVLRESERFDQAVAACKELFERYARSSDIRDIRRSLSIIYSSANEPAKAEEQLRLMLEADPTDATAHNDLGYIMADQGRNLDEAERLVRRAIDLDREERKASSTADEEENAAFLDSLGWVLFRKGKADEARPWLEKASSMAEGADDPVVWDHLGDVAYRLEDTAKARAAWEKAVHLYEVDRRRKPDDRLKEVKHKLQTLEPAARPR